MSPGRRSLKCPRGGHSGFLLRGKTAQCGGVGLRKALSTVSGSKSLMVFLELVTP